MKKEQTPGLIFQPKTYKAMRRGINQLAGAIRPTLGPGARTVAIDKVISSNGMPEMLDSGGIIARRIIELADRDADMGAMLLRSLLVRQHEQMGDGAATTAVLFQAVFDAGLRYIAAGGNANRVRYYLEKALPLVLDQLDEMTFHVEGKEALAGIADSICHDPPLADLLGEIFDVIGEYGQLDVRKDQGRGLRREYVDGVYWNGGLFSRAMIDDPMTGRTEYENATLVVCDFEFEEPRDLFPIIETAYEAGVPALVIVIRRLSEKAMALVTTANRADKMRVMAVKLPGLNPVDRTAALEDIAVLTGATPLLKEAGFTAETLKPEHFGRARRAWANRHNFGLMSGRGSARDLRQHILNLEASYQRTQDRELRTRLQQRIGRLMGGSATLWIGGATQPEIDLRKALAERTADTLRAAVRDGVLPGAGVALLNCRPALDQHPFSDPDERAAYRILSEALAEPARAIWENAGYDPGAVMAKLSFEDSGCGFDAIRGQVVNVREAGILDSAAVIKQAVRSAVTTAALALSVDVLIHVRNPEMVAQPK